MNIILITATKEISNLLNNELKNKNIDYNLYITSAENFEDLIKTELCNEKVLLITDEKTESIIWNIVNTFILSGFIIAMSEIDSSSIKSPLGFQKVNGIERGVRYISAALADPKSKLMAALQVEVVQETVKEQTTSKRQVVDNLENDNLIPPEYEADVYRFEEIENSDLIPPEHEADAYRFEDTHYTNPVSDTESDAAYIEFINAQPDSLSKVESTENKRVEDTSEDILINKQKIEIDLEKKKIELELLNQMVLQRKRVQQMLLNTKSNDDCKVVGVWSPAARQGVSTFTINYAHYLTEIGKSVIVLEGIRKAPYLKSKLKSYMTIEEDWLSYAHCLKNLELDISRAVINYRNVIYFPLDKSDLDLDWDAEFLRLYIKTISSVDVVLIDLENGPMSEYTRNIIEDLDELFIMIDDSIYENIAWKDFILRIQKEAVNSKLLFNKCFDFSKFNDIKSFLNYEEIYKLPDLTYDALKNNYMSEPLIYYTKVDINSAFDEITTSLLNIEIQKIQNKKPKFMTTFDNQLNALKRLLRN